VTGPKGRYSLPPLRILVVDDCPDTRESFRHLLGIWGHQVCEAADAAAALEAAIVFRPDVALVDIVLPGQDGLDLAEQLRALPGLEQIVVVTLTGYPGPDKIDRSYAVGARHFLTKPADPVLLRGLLGSLYHATPAEGP
jgi:CheY-like chemotaxis protein